MAAKSDPELSLHDYLTPLSAKAAHGAPNYDAHAPASVDAPSMSSSDLMILRETVTMCSSLLSDMNKTLQGSLRELSQVVQQQKRDASVSAKLRDAPAQPPVSTAPAGLGGSLDLGSLDKMFQQRLAENTSARLEEQSMFQNDMKSILEDHCDKVQRSIASFTDSVGETKQLPPQADTAAPKSAQSKTKRAGSKEAAIAETDFTTVVDEAVIMTDTSSSIITSGHNPMGVQAQKDKIRMHMQRQAAQWRKMEVAHHVPSSLKMKKPVKTTNTTLSKFCFPGSTGIARRFIEHKAFNFASSFLIIGNAVWIAYASDQAMIRWSNDLDRSPPKAWFNTVDRAFIVAFVVELVLRIGALRLSFFTNVEWKFNWFDFTIVVISVLDWVTTLSLSISALRVIRLVRLMRILRIIREVRLLSKFNQIISTIADGVKVILPITGVMFFLTFMVALAVMSLLLSTGDNEHSKGLAKKYYGSVQDTMRTLFYACSHGLDWSLLLEEHAGFAYVVLFGYIMFVTYGLLPMIVGSFVVSAIETTTLDSDVAMAKRTSDSVSFSNKLRALCWDVGIKPSDIIGIGELTAILRSHDIKMFFDINGIDLAASELFPILDVNNDGAISVAEFLGGCTWLKMNIQSIPTMFISEQMDVLSRELKSQKDQLKAFGRSVGQLERHLGDVNRAQPVKTHRMN